MRVLVTGAAGFIGSHVAAVLNHSGNEVLCVDNFSDYYDPEIKKLRVSEILKGLNFKEADLSQHNLVERLFKEFRPNSVVHLAAQAGVRLPQKNYRVFHSSDFAECCCCNYTRHLS